jgi:hypothetical protein
MWVFLSPRQIPEYCHDRFFPNPLPIILPCDAIWFRCWQYYKVTHKTHSDYVSSPS